MDHRRIVALLALVSLLSLTVARADDEEKSRLWTDATGKFQVSATLIEAKGKRVVLRKLDGSRITLSVDALSTSDRIYLANKAKRDAKVANANSKPDQRANAPQGRRPNPLMAAAPAALPKPPQSGAPSLPLDGPVYSTEELGPPKATTVQPSEPLPPLDIGNGFVHTLGPFPGTIRTSPTLSLDRPSGAFGITVEMLDRRAGKTFSVSSSVRQAEERTTPRPVPGLACSIVSLSPRGQNSIYQGTDAIHLIHHDAATNRTLTFYDMSPLADNSEICILQGLGTPEVKELARWSFPACSLNVAQTTRSRLLGNDLLMIPLDSKLVVWSIATGNCLYQIQLESRGLFAASRSGQFLAVADRDRCHLLDAATGAPLGTLPDTQSSVQGLAFAPDSRRLAVMDAAKTIVWDIAQGETVFEVANPTTPPRFGGWMSDSLLLTSSGLFDVDSQLKVWQYELPKLFHPGPGYLVSNLGIGKPKIAFYAVPHAGAAAVLQRIEQLQDDAFVLEPGDTVKLEINVPRTMDKLAALEQLKTFAESLGLQVDPAASTSIAVTYGNVNKDGPVVFTDERGNKSFARALYQQAMLVLKSGKQVYWSGSIDDTHVQQREVPSGGMSAEKAASRMPPMSLDGFRSLLPKRVLRPDIARMIGRSVIRNDRWQDAR